MAWSFGKGAVGRNAGLDDRVQVPKEILDRIDYESWEALSWALQHRWIQDYKWLLSKIKGDDFGVPPTVAMMWGLNQLMQGSEHYLTSGSHDEIGFPELRIFDRVKPELVSPTLQLMIQGYLLGTDYVNPMWVMRPNGTEKPGHLVQTGVVQDEHGANQLEGELRRYWAKRNGIQQSEAIASIKITPLILEDYCRTYSLNGDVQFGLGKRLFL